MALRAMKSAYFTIGLLALGACKDEKETQLPIVGTAGGQAQGASVAAAGGGGASNAGVPGLMPVAGSSTSTPLTSLDAGPQITAVSSPNDAGAADAGGAIDAGTAPQAAADAGAVQEPAKPGAPAPVPSGGKPWLEPAPRAKCAEGDNPDQKVSGLNGNFNCNLKVAGKVAAPHFLSHAWYKDCAYVNAADGTAVIKVPENGEPKVMTTLTAAGFRSNWETMKVNEKRGLLAGFESNGAQLSVYDVSKDCAAPVLQGTLNLGLGAGGHAGNWSPDGTIYYASSSFAMAIHAVDMTDPKAPKVITSNFDRHTHDLYVDKEGNRGFFSVSYQTSGSLAIMDLSEIQARKPNARGRLIKELMWPDGSWSQYSTPVTYGGKEYLMFSDELGSGACGERQPHWGYGRIFDIQDIMNPKLVSLIKTEAQDSANCASVGSTLGFGSGTHYCNVDRLEDPRLFVCGEWAAGVRVYDVRDPYKPREVAYFDRADANVPGLVRVLPEQRKLWVATTAIDTLGGPGTFYVLEFPEGTEPAQILEN